MIEELLRLHKGVSQGTYEEKAKFILKEYVKIHGSKLSKDEKEKIFQEIYHAVVDEKKN